MFSTIIAFAPQPKTEDSLLGPLQATHAKARDKCCCDYSFYLLVGNLSSTALSEFSTLRKEGILSLEIYMTYTALRLHDSQILDVLFEARSKSITIIHAENDDMIS